MTNLSRLSAVVDSLPTSYDKQEFEQFFLCALSNNVSREIWEQCLQFTIHNRVSLKVQMEASA